MDNTDPDRLAITQASIKALQWQLTAKDNKTAALERQLATQPAQVNAPDPVLPTTCDRASQYSSDGTSSGTCESAAQTYALPPKIQARAAQTAEANHVEVAQAREEITDASRNLNTDSTVAKPQLAKRDSTVVKPQVAYPAHKRLNAHV